MTILWGWRWKVYKWDQDPGTPSQSLKVGPKDLSSAPQSLKVEAKDPFQSLKKNIHIILLLFNLL